MANTYSQLHVQTIFAVKNRFSLIAEDWEERLYRYITGIIQNNGHKLLAINGMPDHVHVLIGMRPVQSLSSLMKDVKTNSSKWINEEKLIKAKFSWQEGFGAFSYSRSQIPNVIAYIEGQKEHHRKKTFIEEYRGFLKAFDVDYDDRYIFEPVE